VCLCQRDALVEVSKRFPAFVCVNKKYFSTKIFHQNSRFGLIFIHQKKKLLIYHTSERALKRDTYTHTHIIIILIIKGVVFR
jgi:hypothetical protein